MKVMLIGFGYDDYEVIDSAIRSDPYALRRLIFPADNKNIKNIGYYIHYNYSQSKPKFHSKIYFGSAKPSEFLLKGKFEICDDIDSADIIVDDSPFASRPINISFVPDDSKKKIWLVESEFSDTKGICVDYPNRILEFVVSGKCVKPIYRTIDILRYCETPENDLTPEICQEIEKMITSNDKDVCNLGLMTLFSMNVLTFPEITKYFLAFESRPIFEYPFEVNYMLSHIISNPYKSGFQVSQKELSLIYKFFSKKTNSPETLIRNTFDFKTMRKGETSYYIDYDDKDFWNELR